MWIFTPRGFFSIVKVPGSSDVWQVRARRKRDLTPIAEKHDLSIEETPKRDYPYRVYCGSTDLKRIVLAFAAETRYSNFKGAIPPEDTEYASACSEVWAELAGSIDDRSGPGSYRDFWSEVL